MNLLKWGYLVIGGLVGTPLVGQTLLQPPAVAYLVPKWKVGITLRYSITALDAKVYNNKDTSYIGFDTTEMLIHFDSINTRDGYYHFTIQFANGSSKKDNELSRIVAKAREGVDFHFTTTPNGKFSKFVNAAEAQKKIADFINDKKAKFTAVQDALKELAKWEELLLQEQAFLMYCTGEFQQLTTFLSERVSFKDVLRGNTFIKPLDGSPMQPATATLQASRASESITASMTQETGWIKKPASANTISEESRHRIIAEVTLDPDRWPERSVNYQSSVNKNLELFKARVITRIE